MKKLSEVNIFFDNHFNLGLLRDTHIFWSEFKKFVEKTHPGLSVNGDENLIEIADRSRVPVKLIKVRVADNKKDTIKQLASRVANEDRGKQVEIGLNSAMVMAEQKRPVHRSPAAKPQPMVTNESLMQHFGTLHMQINSLNSKIDRMSSEDKKKGILRWQ